MSSLAGLLGVFVEVVVLLALAVAVASPRVGGAVIVVSIVAIIATRHLWSQQGGGSDSRIGHRGDDDGGGPRHRRPRLGGTAATRIGGLSSKRQLALHVAEHELLCPMAAPHLRIITPRPGAPRLRR